MANTQALLMKLHEQKSVVNLEINAKIKQLQRKLVTISFTSDNQSKEHTEIVERIKSLRSKIFKNNGIVPQS